MNDQEDEGSIYSSRISSLATVLLDAVGGWGTFPFSIVYILFFAELYR